MGRTTNLVEITVDLSATGVGDNRKFERDEVFTEVEPILHVVQKTGWGRRRPNTA